MQTYEKLKPSSACCLYIIQDWRCSAGSAAPRANWFNIVWTIFMKPSRKWPLFFFFFLSAARRKRSILPHNLAAGFIFQSSGGATLTAQNTIHTPEHTNSSQTNMFKSLCTNNVIITCKIKCDPINLTPFVLRCFISDVIQCTPVCLFN